MRTLALVVALLAAQPAFAQTLDERLAAQRKLQEDSFRSQQEYEAARNVERRQAATKRQAALNSLCARVGNVRIGLNTEGVLKSCWGKPNKINTTITASHRHAQWVYGGGQYVYLTDGIVTAIQASH